MKILKLNESVKHKESDFMITCERNTDNSYNLSSPLFKKPLTNIKYVICIYEPGDWIIECLEQDGHTWVWNNFMYIFCENYDIADELCTELLNLENDGEECLISDIEDNIKEIFYAR